MIGEVEMVGNSSFSTTLDLPYNSNRYIERGFVKMSKEKWTQQPMRTARREYILGLLEELANAVKENEELSVEDVQIRMEYLSDKIGERYTVVEIADDNDKARFFIWDTAYNKSTNAGKFANIEDADEVACKMNEADKQENEAGNV